MRTLEVDGVEVRLEGAGSEAVVMIHGWPDTLRLWDGQVAALQDRRRCVRFTLPGFDLQRPPRRPSADDLVAFIGRVVDQVSPHDPVTLLLHDWGCVFGLQYAMAQPQRVARVIAVDVGDSSNREFLRSLSPKAKAMIAAYQLWLALAWRVRGTLGTRMTRWMARQLRCPTESTQIGWQMNYPYWLAWTGQLRRLRPVRPAWPLLYVYGERKPVMFHSPQWLRSVREAPGCEVHGLRTGHWVMVQQPAAFNELVLRWLDGAGPAAGTAGCPAPAMPQRS